MNTLLLLFLLMVQWCTRVCPCPVTSLLAVVKGANKAASRVKHFNQSGYKTLPFSLVLGHSLTDP